jgi:hypothetical protein
LQLIEQGTRTEQVRAAQANVTAAQAALSGARNVVNDLTRDTSGVNSC